MNSESEAIYFSILIKQKELKCSFLDSVLYYIEENDLDEEEFSKIMKNNILFIGELEADAKKRKLLKDRRNSNTLI